jgi:Galactose oxidase, central domain
MHDARTVYSVNLLDDGQVLFAGGRGNNPDRVLDNAELFNPANGTFTTCQKKLSRPRMEQLGIYLAPPQH